MSITGYELLASGGGSGSSTDPLIIPVSNYGAKGDGVLGTTGSITSGLAVFTDSNASFQTTDVGKVFCMTASGSGGVDLVTTILSRQSATQVTLNANATQTFTATAYYVYGTDDTAAIQSAINACTQANNSGVPQAPIAKYIIQFNEACYIINGAQIQTGHYNTQLTLPIISTANYFMGMELRGRGGEFQPVDGGNSVPVINGTILFSTASNPANFSASTGVPSVIGANATGRTGSTFSDIQLVCRGICFMGPHAPGNFMVDAGWCEQAIFEQCVVITNEQPSSMDYRDAWFTSGGFRMPKVNNNSRSELKNCSIQGVFCGLMPGEHTNGVGMNFIAQCTIAIGIETAGDTWFHAAQLGHMNTENNKYGIAGDDFTSGSPKAPSRVAYINFTMWDVQHGTGIYSSTADIQDTSNFVVGQGPYQLVLAGTGLQHGLTINGGVNTRFFDSTVPIWPMSGGSDTTGIAAFTTATPSSGVAFTPLATSDSIVYIPVAATTTGTVTITMGPSTGAENPVVPSSNLVALSEPTFTLLVPKNWKVVVTKTGTTVAIGTVNIQAR